MVLRTKEEALNALRETVKATKETYCLVYTGHGVVEILKEKDCKGYTVIEKYNATYNNCQFSYYCDGKPEAFR